MISDRMFIGELLMSITSYTIIIMNSYVVSRWNHTTSNIKGTICAAIQV